MDALKDRLIHLEQTLAAISSAELSLSGLLLVQRRLLAMADTCAQMAERISSTALNHIDEDSVDHSSGSSLSALSSLDCNEEGCDSLQGNDALRMGSSSNGSFLLEYCDTSTGGDSEIKKISRLVDDAIDKDGSQRRSMRPFVLRPLVPVVDYYRYLRALFANDETLLFQVEQRISATDSYDDTVAYLRSTMPWTDSDMEVESFYAIVCAHYKS